MGLFCCVQEFLVDLSHYEDVSLTLFGGGYPLVIGGRESGLWSACVRSW